MNILQRLCTSIVWLSLSVNGRCALRFEDSYVHPPIYFLNKDALYISLVFCKLHFGYSYLLTHMSMPIFS